MSIMYRINKHNNSASNRNLAKSRATSQTDSFLWKDLNLVPIGHLVPGIGIQIK